MKCHDESKLLNYQEPHNYLYRNIKFHKPVQISFFLPPSVFLGGSERQQEGTSVEELFINAPVISLDLHFVWGRNKGGVAGLFFILPHAACEGCRRWCEGVWKLCFPTVLFGVFLFSVINPTEIISLCSCGCPWIYFHWQTCNQLWSETKKISFQEIVHTAGSLEQIPCDGFLGVLKISVC